MITIPQTLLSQIITTAAKVIKGRTTVPVIECIKLRLGGDGISVSATDFDVWVTLTTKGFREKDAVTAMVPGKQVASVIAGLPNDEDVSFSLKGKRLTIKTKNSQYNFGTLHDESEWPEMPAESKPSPVKIDSGLLVPSFLFVSPSMAIESTRYFMCGVHFTSQKKWLRLMAADGHQVSCCTLETEKKMDLPDKGIIIPRDTMRLCSELIAAASDGESIPVSFSATENKCRFDFAADDYRVCIRSKLIDGEYPHMDAQIPYDRGHVVVSIPRNDMMAVLGRLRNIVMAEKYPSVTINATKDYIDFSATSPSGDAVETIKTKGESTINTVINLNKLSSLVAPFSGEMIDLLLDPKDGRAGAIIIAPHGENITKDSNQFGAVMPMRG